MATDAQPAIASQTSTVEALLTRIAAQLSELVQIETYCAMKVAEKYAKPAEPSPAATPVSRPSVPAQPAPAQPAPAQAVPASRPGAGTVGGIVWDICERLMSQTGEAPSKEAVLAAIKQHSPTINNQPVNELTAATQYSKWRGAKGLPRLPRGFGASKPAAAAVSPSAVPAQPAPRATPVAVPVQIAMEFPPPAPIPAASVPSVIAPAATPPQMSFPPWLRQD